MSDDKCNICALKVIFNQGTLEKERSIEDFLGTLRRLQDKKIIEKGYERRVFIGDGSNDKSEMCAVNSKFFLKDNRDKKCPEFILNMGLSIPEALALNTARSTDRLTAKMHNMTRYILSLSVIAVIIGIVAIICA